MTTVGKQTRKDYRVGAYEDGKLKEIFACADENDVNTVCRMLVAQKFAVRVRVGTKPPATLTEGG